MVFLGVSCFVLGTILRVFGIICLVSSVILSGKWWEGIFLITP